MEFQSKYVSKTPDENGYITYSQQENAVWQQLYSRQIEIVRDRACDEFLEGLQKLNLVADEIPQLPEVNQRLKQCTGWEVSPVSALIPHDEFFNLLANKKFPAATFIRSQEELDYVQEPDIFHELFGHCPMLTNQTFADFVESYARFVLNSDEDDWPLMQRLFWFTVEFGLIQTDKGLRAYGGGILSSMTETVYCVESEIPQRQLFNPLAAFRTPYRIDQLQPVYFVIRDYQELYDFITSDIKSVIQKARELGEFPPLFEVDPDNPCIHVLAC